LLVVPPATATSAAAVAAPRPPPPPPGNVAVQRLVTLVQGVALVVDQQRELTSERVNQLHQLALQSDALAIAALQRRQALNDNPEDELYDADDLNVRLAAALQSSNAPSAPSRLCPGVEFQAERWNSSVEASTRGIYPEYNMMQPALSLQNTISAMQFPSGSSLIMFTFLSFYWFRTSFCFVEMNMFLIINNIICHCCQASYH